MGKFARAAPLQKKKGTRQQVHTFIHLDLGRKPAQRGEIIEIM